MTDKFEQFSFLRTSTFIHCFYVSTSVVTQQPVHRYYPTSSRPHGQPGGCNFCFGTGHFVDGGKRHLSELGRHCEFIRLRREHFHNHVLCSSLGAVNQLSSTFGVENNQSFAWLVISVAAKLRTIKCVLARRTFWRQSNNKCPGPVRSLATSPKSMLPASALVSVNPYLFHKPPGTSVLVSVNETRRQMVCDHRRRDEGILGPTCVRSFRNLSCTGRTILGLLCRK